MPAAERVFKEFPVQPIPILADPTVAGILSEFLPEYRDNRERWPLWTYRRGRGDGSRRGEGVPNWSEPWGEDVALPIWRDRLRWSSLMPLSDVVRVLRDTAGVPLAYRPGRPHQEATSGDRRFGIPEFFQAYEAAILASFAHPNVPSDPAAITVPGPWSMALPLDLEDYGELLHRFAAALQGSDAMFMALAVQRPGGVGKNADRDRGLSLLERLGFHADRSRTTKNTLPPPYLSQLSKEAVAIATAVRTWKPSEDLTRRVKILIGSADLEPSDMARLERDVPLRPSRRSAVAEAATRLRFPFLTWFEVGQVLDHRSRSASVVGDSLLRGRLAADISGKRLRKIMS